MKELVHINEKKAMVSGELKRLDTHCGIKMHHVFPQSEPASEKQTYSARALKN